ncbi:hypothetical protein FNF31_02987 [Cafeteria roenbergensis]|uniref:Uncharacterized protein n=1 Tax=Cafeteria roenbergensis TaxID=33653 RepID=A0A5A8DC54_CAFRO|nr:hypothetical protein FNF31_02987 [Cafeteria roenbergensis]
MASAARGDAFPRDIEDRIKGMLQAVGSPRECDGREPASLGMRTGVPGHAGGGQPQDGDDWDEEDDPGARGWGRESYDPPADSLDALEEECQFSSALSAVKFFSRMGHDEGADRALSALLDLCSAVRGGALASPAGTGTSDGTGDGAGTSASYSQLRLQFDLMQAEHREQLREMRRSLRKALRRIEGLKTARSAAITAPARPAAHSGAGLGSDPEAVSPPASVHATTQAAAGGRGDRRAPQPVPPSPPSRRGSAGGGGVAMTSPAGSRRRLDGHAPPSGQRSKRKSAVQAVGERQDALAGDVADIRAEMARMRQAMARETREKDELGRRLARTAKAATTREKRLTRALKAVASKLPGGSKEFQSLLRGLSAPDDSATP